MTTQSPRNKGQCSLVGPAQPKGKLLRRDVKVFPRDSDSECSVSLSGLLTYSILPCTPSPLASHCQLTPPAPSPLAHELTPRRHRRRHCPPPVAAFILLSNKPPPARAPTRYVRCRRRGLWFVPRVSRPRYDLRRRRRRSRGCIHPTTEQTPATATGHTARYVPPSLSCLPSPPPRGRSRAIFFYSFSPPPGTEAYHITYYFIIIIKQ
jgi:hypothetical protein